MGSNFVSCRVTRGARTRRAGFTLVELLIVLMISAIILGISAPTFGDFMRNARLTRAANDLLASVQLARTEAVKRQRIVSLCPASGGDEPPACRAAGFTGWMVFADENGDCRRAEDETVVRLEVDLDERVLSDANGGCISFAANGFARSLEAPQTATAVLFCDKRWGTQARPAGSDQSAARGVMLTPTGRSSVTRDKALIDAWGLSCG